MILFFLSSGLFLGWSLGANDAANIFGTAVGSGMIRFARAAAVASVFVVLGAVIGGAGTSLTLGELGAVNAPAGAFMVALAAGVTVAGMTRLSLPVSTSQAIVGAIIGWNLFSGVLTDLGSLTKIVVTWVVCPVLSAVLAMLLFGLLRIYQRRFRLHLLREDALLRWGLLAVGAFGAYSLGANNIANVVGVFVPLSPLPSLALPGGVVLSDAQLLFLIGGLSIAVGIFTFSHRVIATVGGGLFKLNAESALVVVLSQALVLFFFSSRSLESWLLSHGLPPMPLVPVSASQAVVGAVIGIGLIKGGRGIRYRVMGGIASGWITTPVIAGLLAFVSLFFLQNVFGLQVFRDTGHRMDETVIARLVEEGYDADRLLSLSGRVYASAADLSGVLRRAGVESYERRRLATSLAALDSTYVTAESVRSHFGGDRMSEAQRAALVALDGRAFSRSWEMLDELERTEPQWRPRPTDRGAELANRRLGEMRAKARRVFRVNGALPAH